MRRISIISFGIFLAAFLFCTTSYAGVQDIFYEANKDYSEGRYREAEEGYRKILDEGIESAEIRNNLGEALYRQDKIGEAVFQFMMAHRLEPRDADITYNLELVRERITDKIPDPHVNIFLRPFNYLHESLSLKDSLIGFVSFSFLFWGLAALYIFVRRDTLKWIVWVFGLLFVIQSAILIKKEFLERPFGVVIAEEAPVYSGPGESNVLLFNLHEGADFNISTGQENNWIQIKLADGKKGWINSDDMVTQ